MLRQVGEVLLRLRRRRGAETLVVLDRPAADAAGRRFRQSLYSLSVKNGCDARPLLTLTIGVTNSRRKAFSPRVLEERRPVAVEEVDDQPLDVRAVVVLVGHDHQVAVPQRAGARRRSGVVLALLQAEDLLELGDLLVVHDRRVVGVAHVEQLAAQREDAVVVAADHREARDGERLRRVALGDDERALVAVLAAGLVGVVELGDAGEARAFLPSVFFRSFCCLFCANASTSESRIAAAVEHVLEELVRQVARGSPNFARAGRRASCTPWSASRERGVLDQAVDEDLRSCA